MAKAKKTKSSSNFEIRVGLKGLIWTGSLVFVGVVWAFILGVIVGRGYDPIDLVSSLGHQKKVSMDAVQNQTINKSSFKAKVEVLKPTELTFYKKVKEDFLEPKPSILDKISKEAVNKKKKVHHEYLIQISSYKNKKDAIALIKFLREKGFFSKIEKAVIGSKVWYRVHVVIKGEREDLRKEIKKLKKMGFKDIIVRQRG